ncbi:MAG: hotdog domain-containing protein, partial [Methylovulum sp.]|nr:hotdog domain-containing protein [Methylovulum sp.]
QQVNVGELVTLQARVNHVGRSSMEIGVKVFAEHLRTYEKRYTTSCYYTMVAIDENGKSVEVPRLQLETEAEKKLFAAAEIRKKMRQESLEKIRGLQIDIEDDF